MPTTKPVLSALYPQLHCVLKQDLGSHGEDFTPRVRESKE